MPWPGSMCKLRVVWWEGELPPPEDFLRTDTGTCYRIERVVESRPGSAQRATFEVVRLEKNAVPAGAPGVWPWSWESRS